jgi:hypothetical protein
MNINNIAPEWAAGAVIAIPAFFLFLKKIALKTAIADTGIEATDAQCAVIEMLRSEVKRMAVSNKELGVSLQDFQRENVELRKEISFLHETINQLSERLNAIDRIRERCGTCEHNLSMSGSWERNNGKQ